MRGCAEGLEEHEFLRSEPEIVNPITEIPDFATASAVLWQAIQSNGAITVFGDYDVDGVTAATIISDLIKSAGSTAEIFIPDRFDHDYGLTDKAVDDLLEISKPSLIFVVDCGSNSTGTIERLRGMGIDVVVLDHHGIAGGVLPHPATAHLNPKAWDDLRKVDHPLCSMSAAGLAFLFADEFARQHEVGEWIRDRALLLGGLGTMVDVMPLTKLNRQLVKHSISLARHPEKLLLVPGLCALGLECRVKEITSYTYGYVFGPHLNAAGRVENARTSINLLAALSIEDAQPIAKLLSETNQERRALQATALTEATAAAEAVLKLHPNTKVLVLCNKNWHPGIVGIVAGRLKEAFERPVFVCGWNDHAATPFWKGSGRSLEGVDLGGLVHKAVSEGVLLGGGGHAMAAGIRIAEDQVGALERFFEARTAFDPSKHIRTYEIIGYADWTKADAWMGVMDHLEPFGAGNPRPYFLLSNAIVATPPTPLRKNSDGSTWAYGFNVQTPKFAGKVHACDLERAKLLKAGQTLNFVLGLTRSTGKNGTVYLNWEAIDWAASL
jgi:single-stranded-DNA-specific exonuclease